MIFFEWHRRGLSFTDYINKEKGSIFTTAQKRKEKMRRRKTKQSHGTIVSWLQHIYSWIYG
jgi:hypothetical protein